MTALHTRPGQFAEIFVTPAGSVSLTTTFGAALGPAFLTVIVHVMLPPAATGFGVAVLLSVIAALVLTVVVTWHAVASTVTPVPADPTHVFVIGPATFGAFPVIVTVLVPTGTEADVQLTAEPLTVHALPGQVAVILVTPAGSVSLMTTLGATLGPALVTAIDQVIVPPAATGFGVAVLTSVTAAFGLTTVVTEHAVVSMVTPAAPVATHVFVIGPATFGALPVMVTVVVPIGNEAAVQVAA